MLFEGRKNFYRLLDLGFFIYPLPGKSFVAIIEPLDSEYLNYTSKYIRRIGVPFECNDFLDE